MATPVKIIDTNLPNIVLVGRVNVGKSTLYNKIIEEQHAIISDVPGTTRTRNTGVGIWRGKSFQMVDTGGLTFDEDVPLEKDIIEQTELALKDADLILFVIDIQAGALPQEKELVNLIKTKYQDKPIIFIGNKVDSTKWEGAQYDPEISKLNLGEPVLVSAQNSRGVGDLLDIIYEKLKDVKKEPLVLKDEKIVKISLLGKPNVGKSSLFNKLIGEDQVIVSEMPHTTREPFDTLIEYKDKPYIFVDTAGIRRKSRVRGILEKLGVHKSIKNVEKSDIILFTIDASEPISDQDKQLGGFLKEHSRSVIIVVNKWDLIEENSDKFRNDFKVKVYANFPHLSFAPIVFVSAKTGYKTHQIFPLVERAWNERNIEIPSEALENFLDQIAKRRLPSRGKGTRHPKLFRIKQINAGPPIFELSIKSRTSLHSSYLSYIKNQLREKFSFYATPIVIKIDKVKK